MSVEAEEGGQAWAEGMLAGALAVLLEAVLSQAMNSVSSGVASVQS